MQWSFNSYAEVCTAHRASNFSGGLALCINLVWLSKFGTNSRMASEQLLIMAWQSEDDLSLHRVPGMNTNIHFESHSEKNSLRLYNKNYEKEPKCTQKM